MSIIFRCRCGSAHVDDETFIACNCGYDWASRWHDKFEEAESVFLKNYSYEQLKQQCPELSTRLDEQIKLFLRYLDSMSKAEIDRHGPAMLRGFELSSRTLTDKKALNFNNVAKQFGFGPHPGAPPPQSHGSAQFKWWYRRYLTSADWAERRDLVMKRCSQICEGCGKEPANEVHHHTYNHVGNEFLFELVGLCKSCHERIHKSMRR